MDRGVAGAWGTMVGIVAVRDLSKKHRPPLPSELLSSFVVFGLLGLIAGPAPQVARLTGWGLVVAVLLADSDNILAPVGDFLSGGKGAPGGGLLGPLVPKPQPGPPGEKPPLGPPAGGFPRPASTTNPPPASGGRNF